ncbi:LysR family transcriptional regulator [Paracandidimonas soli]|uniref:LysR family transcriptional regulator n=1 Tax=Paracandidimonas soli TaxID=1917182 RepID=UPI000AB6850D
MLAAFCAVAEELNFARAAERLCMSQPPLSRRIRQLEDLVGTALFVRTTRSVRLTPAGALMYEHARRLTGDLGYMLNSVRELARGEGGALSIGITPSAACSSLVEVLHAFRHAHPNIALDLREMDSVLLSEELRYGRVDIALMRPVAAHESVEMTVVHNEPLVFITRRENAYAGSRVTLGQVLRHPLVGYDKTYSPYLHGLLEQLLAGAASGARIVQTSRLPSILTLVEAGVGAAIVPQSMMHVRSDTLHFHAIEPATGPMAQIVVARPARGRHPAALALMGALLARRQEADRDGQPMA